MFDHVSSSLFLHAHTVFCPDMIQTWEPIARIST